MIRTGWRQWWQGLPIPWLVSGPHGQAEAGGWPAVLDAEIVLLDAARKVAYPDYAPTDALPHLGGDRKLTQGPTETNPNFITRLKTPWDDWARAGSALELLVQLYWGGFTGAVLVQQNGLAYNLSGAPTAGQDPTSLLVTTTCSALSVALTSNVTPPTVSQAGRIIPATNPWWQFAESRSVNPNVSDTDYCNRFAVLFPGSPLPSAFMTSGVATFTGTEDGSLANPWPTVTWNNAFADTSYKIQVGAVTITGGLGPVSVAADNSSKTQTSVRIAASASFTGSVDVIAYQAGANPFADLHPADLSRLQSLIGTWRPNALCVGVYAVAQGNVYGWPVATFSTRSAMGASSIVRFEGINGGW